jgi:23S rRNA (cytidine1920-2'-O)/16S rRNA (cytidine1409-2'-O)-methyltransferase
MPDNDAVTRLDQLLHERGLAETRSRAQALVMAGRVRVDGRVVTKAGTAITATAELEVAQGPAFVSRGGDKLATALDAFGVDVAGLACVDVGASTGGFTDCLLQRGAAHVTALDVGRGQLHQRLRADERVTVLEGVNARLLAPGDLPGPAPSLAVIDVSFISLALVLPPLVQLMARPYRLLPMVKPQFEAGKEDVRKGVVRDARIHAAVLERIAGAAAETGGVVLGACETGHPGPAGNREFFLHVVSSDHPDAATAPVDPLPLLRDAVA